MAHFEWKNDAGHVIALKFDAVRTVEHRHSGSVTTHPVQKGADVADHVRVETPTISVLGYVGIAPLTAYETIGFDPDNRELSGKYFDMELEPVVGTLESIETIELPKGSGKSARATLESGPITALQDFASDLLGPNSVDALVFRPGKGPLEGGERVRSLVTEGGEARMWRVHDLLLLMQEERRPTRFVDVARVYENMFITQVTLNRDNHVYGASFQIELAHVRQVESKLVDTPVPSEARGQRPRAAGGAAAKKGDDDVDEKKKSAALKLAKGLWAGVTGS